MDEAGFKNDWENSSNSENHLVPIVSETVNCKGNSSSYNNFASNNRDGTGDSVYVLFPSSLSVLSPTTSTFIQNPESQIRALELGLESSTSDSELDTRDLESVLTEALIYRYRLFYSINKHTLKWLCSLFGALEMTAGYAVVALKISNTFYHNHNHIHYHKNIPLQKELYQCNLKYSNAVNVLHFVAYLTLTFSGLVLVYGSGFCRKESKVACLFHVYLQIVDLVLILLCLGVLVIHCNDNESGFKILYRLELERNTVEIDALIHVVSLQLICLVQYFSFGLYGAMAYFDVSWNNPAGIRKKSRMGKLLDSDVRLAQKQN